MLDLGKWIKEQDMLMRTRITKEVYTSDVDVNCSKRQKEKHKIAGWLIYRYHWRGMPFQPPHTQVDTATIEETCGFCLARTNQK